MKEYLFSIYYGAMIKRAFHSFFFIATIALALFCVCGSGSVVSSIVLAFAKWWGIGQLVGLLLVKRKIDTILKTPQMGRT